MLPYAPNENPNHHFKRRRNLLHFEAGSFPPVGVDIPSEGKDGVSCWSQLTSQPPSLIVWVQHTYIKRACNQIHSAEKPAKSPSHELWCVKVLSSWLVKMSILHITSWSIVKQGVAPQCHARKQQNTRFFSWEERNVGEISFYSLL